MTTAFFSIHQPPAHQKRKRLRMCSCQRPVQPMSACDVELLVQWIRVNGGYVHQSLQIEDDAPCGCRGVVAAQEISLDTISTTPLVAVPVALELTDTVARETLRPMVPTSMAQSLDALDSGALVVLLLAYERSLGDESVYHPYIQSLPEEPSCPWNLPAEKWETTLAALSGAAASQWEPELRKAHSYVSTVSMGLHEDFGKHMRVSTTDIRWALGIVASRGYGGDPRPGLIPFIDLFNHDTAAAPFYLQSLEITSESASTASISSHEESTPRPFYTVWSSWNGKPRHLNPGEEVYVDYTIGDMTALDVYLSHGFVPAELSLTDN